MRADVRRSGLLRKLARVVLVVGMCLTTRGLACAQPADTEERIKFFGSDIVVSQDGSMLVTETITVVSAGQKIKRGIFRDLIFRYQDPFGHRYSLDLSVQDVTRDGLTENYRIDRRSDRLRIYIGDEDVFLPEGEHTYGIVYRVTRPIGFFPTHDELYWNITGHEWDFVLDSVRISVELPSGISIDKVRRDIFTGSRGSRAREASLSLGEFGDKIVFETTRRLETGEGVTILLGWPKGYIQEPDARQKFQWFLMDNLSVFIGLLGLVLVGCYYGFVWWRFGRDPEKGTIIAHFEAPREISPADARFIMRMGFDSKILSAAIIHMAVVGFLRIKDDGTTFTLEKTGQSDSELQGSELVLARRLFSGGRASVVIDEKSRSVLVSATSELKRFLALHYEKIYFFTNRHFFAGGFLLSLAVVGAMLFTQGAADSATFIFMGIWVTGWSFGVVMLLTLVFGAWKAYLGPESEKSVNLGAALFLTLFAAPFVVFEVIGLTMLAKATSGGSIVCILGLAGLNILFYHLMKAPTQAGRKVMDQIEGLKMYLSVAEKDRLNALHPPEQTPEHFEKLLPYALALDVEQQWAQRFSGALSGLSTVEREYVPQWYQGDRFKSHGVTLMATGIGRSLSDAVRVASRPPSSGGSGSGFSGGGGSSGGGRGGGGGGGW